MGSFRDGKHTGNPGSLFLFLKSVWEPRRITGSECFRCMFGGRDRSSLSLVRQDPALFHTPTLPHPRPQPHSAAKPWHTVGNAPHLSLELLTQLSSGHQIESSTWWKSSGKAKARMSCVPYLSLDCMAKSYQNRRGSGHTLLFSLSFLSFFLSLIFQS